MEDINLIKQYVMRDNRYTFPLENGLYVLPSFIYLQDGSKIDIKEGRAKLLKSPKSQYAQKFKDDIIELRNEYKGIDKRLLTFSLDFPVPIEDPGLWNTILTRYGIPEGEKDIRGKRFFLLNFFFYYPGLIVEIDSDFQERKRLYCRAKDEYLKLIYNLETFRISRYGESVITERYDKEYVRDTIFEKIKDIEYYSNFSPFPLDFSKTIVENYKEENKYPLEFIEKMKKYLGELFIYYDNISITKKDLYCIDPYRFVTGLRKDHEQEFLRCVSGILRHVYRKNLYIHETNKFSLGDVLRITDLVTKRLFKWDDFSGTKVEKWIISILGLPPREYTNSSTSENLRIILPREDESDGGIWIFLEHLGRSGIIPPFWKPSNSY